MEDKRLFGHIEQFNEEDTDWTSYVERLELFLECNEVAANEEKKVKIALTLMGGKVFTVAKDLCFPGKPQEEKWDDLKVKLQTYFSPKKYFLTERMKFEERTQQEGESVQEYARIIKAVAAGCKFGNDLKERLRDRLMSGLLNKDVRRKCRMEKEDKLTFDLVLQTAIQIEQTEIDLSNEKKMHEVHRIESNQRHTRVFPHDSRNIPKTIPSSSQMKAEKSSVQCACCGRHGHEMSMCRLRYYKCHVCGGQGHLKRMCTGQQKHHYVDVEPQDVKCTLDEETSHLLSIDSHLNYVERFQVSTQVEGKPIKFELDTGASVSIVSEQLYAEKFSHIRLEETNLKLAYWGNEKVNLLGCIKVKVIIESEQHECTLYVLKGSGCALLGREWIFMFHTLRNHFECFQNKVNKIVTSTDIQKIIELYPKVFSQRLGKYNGEKVSLRLTDDAKPKFVQPRPVPLMLRTKVEEELQRLEHEGIISKVNYSQWGTPIVPVLKPNGDIRICGDYKVTLNPYLQLDRYPIPRIEELLIGIKTGGKFSILDLSQAYQQMVLEDNAKELVAISTHKGVYVYNRMPFGISSAPGIFQKRISEEFRDIENVKVYFDEILIFGENETIHYETLTQVLKKLNNMGLTLSKEKCKFFQDQIKFLGYLIDRDGIRPGREKIEAILYAPEPENAKQLQSFLGLVNYYRKFLPDLSAIQKPLNDLLCKDTEYNFDVHCQEAFKTIKKMLTEDNALVHFDTTKPIILACDASAYGISAVMLQPDDKKREKPVAFASRRLNKAEENYSQVDKEALAIVFGVKKFDQQLWGQTFTIRSDCKALTSIFGSKHGFPQMAASRLQRYAVFLSGYNFNIEYITSEKNVLADALSRMPLDKTVPDVSNANYLKFICENNVMDTNKIREATDHDEVLRKIKSYVMNEWPSKSVMTEEEKKYHSKKEELTIEDNIVMWGYRVVVPASCKSHLLKELHLNHLGITKMKSVARSYFWWPGIDSDIEGIANSCLECIQNRPEQKKVSLHMWEYPSDPWRRLHIDFLGPFRGKMYLVVEDAFSKWIEVFKMNSTNCQSVVDKFYELFARFGLPDYVVSDNGPPFQSKEFEEFLSRNGIVHKTSPPYYPQCNGQAESAVKIIKSFLKKMPDDKQLQRFLFDYRIAKHTTTNKSPAELLQNRVLKTRFELIRPKKEDKSRPNEPSEPNITETNTKESDRVQFMKTFNEGDIVWVRDYKSNNPKWTNGMVHKKVGNVIYLVRVGVHVWKRHVDQLMKYKGKRSVVNADVSAPEPSRYVYSSTRSNASSEASDVSDVMQSADDMQSVTSDDMQSVASDIEYESLESNNEQPDDAEQFNISQQDVGRRYPIRLNRRPPQRYL